MTLDGDNCRLTMKSVSGGHGHKRQSDLRTLDPPLAFSIPATSKGAQGKP
jgi:hypothetical protein